jgi:hypothetical protein
MGAPVGPGTPGRPIVVLMYLMQRRCKIKQNRTKSEAVFAVISVF